MLRKFFPTTTHITQQLETEIQNLKQQIHNLQLTNAKLQELLKTAESTQKENQETIQQFNN